MIKQYTAKYIRISDKSQNTLRQHNDTTDKLYIDVITGKSKFADRAKAKELIKDIEAGIISQVTVHEVSRLGRNLIDILTTLEYMHSKGVVIYVHNLGLYSMVDGKESPTFKMVVTILANIAETELATLRERQADGIRHAKITDPNKYKGRAKGSTMTASEICFEHQDIMKYITKNKKKNCKKKTSYRDIAKLTGKCLDTVVRVVNADRELNGAGKFAYVEKKDPFA